MGTVVNIQTEERFWRKVDRRGPDECWTWQASKLSEECPYGQAWLDGKRIYAHRLAWLIENGPIPSGLEVCHRCDCPPCCNPAHLFLDTHAGNMRDKVSKGRGGWLFGSRSPVAKLNEWSACGIVARLLMSDAPTQAEVGREFGVSHGAVNAIWSGKNWAHLFVDDRAETECSQK